MAADMGEDRAGTLGRNALDDGQITLFRASGRELRRQGLMGGVIFCDDQAAGGVLVQAVDDAWAFHSADAGEVPAVVEQGVYDGAVRVTGRGMHDHAAFLVDDDHVFIFIQDVQGDILRLGFRRFRLRNADGDGITAGGGVFRLGGRAVDQHVPAFDQVLNPGAGKLRKVGGKVLVQADFPSASSVVRFMFRGVWSMAVGGGRQVNKSVVQPVNILEKKPQGLLRERLRKVVAAEDQIDSQFLGQGDVPVGAFPVT